ncbi:MAG: hypothetical protein KAS23_10150, partial [Anaerohalosphaera sp.]|nr:hypothetical protein [Anaerohalosphaera sp.]
MKFIHLSDLHVTNDPSALENQMLTQLRESIIWRYDDEEKPAILISGDLVDNGAGDEFDQVVSILTPLK